MRQKFVYIYDRKLKQARVVYIRYILNEFANVIGLTDVGLKV